MMMMMMKKKTTHSVDEAGEERQAVPVGRRGEQGHPSGHWDYCHAYDDHDHDFWSDNQAR